MGNFSKLSAQRLVYLLLRPLCGRPDEGPDVDIYNSAMIHETNCIHRLIFPRFFSKVKVEQDSLTNIPKGENIVTVYVATNIGQLEYNYFNYLFLKENIPLASYENGTSLAWWLPFEEMATAFITKLAAKIKFSGRLPNPVSSGYVENLLMNDKSLFVCLKSTQFYDDLFWDAPSEDIVHALIEAQKKTFKEIHIIPTQFLWARRPEAATRRDNPGALRKLILFWRNYKNRAVAQFGPAISLKDFLSDHPSVSGDDLTKLLKSHLLDMIREERKLVTGPALKPRQWMIDEMVEYEPVQKLIYELANDKKKDVDDLKFLALKYANEIGSDINYWYIENGNRLLTWVFNSMYDGIHFNQDKLNEVRKLTKNNPVIFVPNHRSHVDYLLLSYLLYHNNIAIPHVAAGMNLSFWPLGKFFRKCGAFFMRRTFSGNSLYKAVFGSYLRTLLREGYCQEFFIEGGRSRTGKLRQPKMGMLSMYAQAMIDGAASEVYFVPTSITYDRIAEEGSYIDESKGTAKKKERFKDLFKLQKYVKRRHGKIYVNFGEPISFVKHLENVSSGTSADMSDTDIRMKVVDRLAFDIMVSLNKGAVVTPAALVATALLMEEKRGITLETLKGNIERVRAYLKFRNIKLSDTLTADFDKAITESIHLLSLHKVVELHENFDPIYYSIADDKRHSLDFQKNTILHFLLPLAYVAASISTLIKEERTIFKKEEIHLKVDILKSIFLFEFASHADLVKGDYVDTAIEFLTERKAIQIDEGTGEIFITPLGIEKMRSYRNIIANMLDSYKVAYNTCWKITEKSPQDVKELTKKMFEYGKHMLNLDQIQHPEALCQSSFENAIALFKKAGLLKVEGSKQKLYWNRTALGIKELQHELEVFS